VTGRIAPNHVLIASYLEPERVQRLRLSAPQAEVLYEPSLLRTPVSPHSASTADSENAKLTDLFCENLRRYLASRPLLNVFDRERGY
jgi:hypothetical protein